MSSGIWCWDQQPWNNPANRQLCLWPSVWQPTWLSWSSCELLLSSCISSWLSSFVSSLVCCCCRAHSYVFNPLLFWPVVVCLILFLSVVIYLKLLLYVAFSCVPISLLPVKPRASEVSPQKLLLISRRSLVAGWLPCHLPVRLGKVQDYASVPTSSPLFMTVVITMLLKSMLA